MLDVSNGSNLLSAPHPNTDSSRPVALGQRGPVISGG